ncbi:winged helix-turn-helix transcriptional regulator [Streptomyces sp. DSM 44915]|uniref:Winged helix-turn-helix transcriptional regulator n=1 Tax=Streptomyces chisholmiae TaxID=3075540 RepID=A0ABU2JYP6_9ACTN|nr:winged helix-turn-helix transcriptional regulator [Streptomyces sp. DSM 44915]MDT0269644.1 winged helix-turn-helix transcriptional regulator [Streptomyces sp. DSM 44915]
MPRRSYDQYCAIARALDAVGDRWALLIVRELLAGPRRYTDLHTELPGVSTDMLAARLKSLEREAVLTRRRLPPPASAAVYELTDRGRALLPVLTSLAAWGAPALAECRDTDAVRAHWLALPLREQLLEYAGAPAGVTVDVELPEGTFHLHLDADRLPYGDGPAATADAALRIDADTHAELAAGALTARQALTTGRIAVRGELPVGVD